MKFFNKKLILFLAGIICSYKLFTQTTITIGSGISSTVNYPMTRAYDYGIWESIYTKSEINTAGGSSGNITSIEFYKSNTDDGLNIQNVTVYMKLTSASTLASGTFSSSGYTTVFTGTVTNSASPGWKIITLSTPFYYDNVNNLQIAIDKGFQAFSASYATWYYFSTTAYENRRCVQDGAACSSLTATLNKPNIRLTLSSGPVNDNCSGAISLSVNSPCSYTAGDATGATGSGLAACSGVDTDDMWYSFVATATTHTITLASSVSYDGVIQLYSGTCGGLTSLSCRDVGGNGSTETMTYSSFTIGATYYVRVYDWNTASPVTTTFNICVVGSGSCSSPSTQASSFTSSSITSSSMTIGWTRGNGNAVMVIARAGSAPSDPSSGTSYTANSVYGSGSAVGSGYCVYNSTGTSVNITGLSASTTYYFAIYEYNSTGTCYNLTELTGNATTSASGCTNNTWNGSFSTDWGTASNWSLGVVPGATHNAIIANVANDPIVTVATSVCGVTIQSGGVLQTDASITISGTFAINNGGTYIHNNIDPPNTTIFAGTESFGTSSTFEIRNWPGISYKPHNGSTVVTDPMNSTPYGNLTINWNVGTQWEWQDYMTQSSNKRILGDLYIQYTGSNDIHLSGNGNQTHELQNVTVDNGGALVFKAPGDAFVTTHGSSTLNITGNLTIGGVFWLNEDGEMSNSYVNTLNIYGNLTMTSTAGATSMELNRGQTFSSGTYHYTDPVFVVNLYGNLNMSGGRIVSSHSGACLSNYCTAYSEFHFAKNGTQTYNNTSTASGSSGSNGLGVGVYFIIDATSTLQLQSNFILPTRNTSYTGPCLIVNGTLDAGTYQLYPNNTANATFSYTALSLGSGSRLKTANTNGFFTESNTLPCFYDNAFNTVAITLNSNSTIEYNGSSSQVLTNGGATPLDYAILDINNTAAGGSALSMSTTGNVNCDQLRLRDGVVYTDAYTLKVINVATTAIQNHSTASYINTGPSGILRRNISTPAYPRSYDFPVGNGNTNSYQLLNLNITSGNTASHIDVNFDNPSNATGTGLPLTEGADSYTAILNNGGTAASTGNTYGGVWTMTPNIGSANYDVTLYGRNYDNQDTKHTIVKRNNSATAWALLGTFGSSTSTSPITVNRTGYNSFSQFAIAKKGVALPVQLTSFTGSCDNSQIELHWTTATETDNDFFTIEQSTDNQNFNTAGIVQGAGNSSTSNSYSWKGNLEAEKMYYRIKQTDFDGKSSHSNSILVNCNEMYSAFEFDVNGNIIHNNEIPLSFYSDSEKEVLVVLTDPLGREVYSKLIVTEEGNQLILMNPFPPLAPGLYIITASEAGKMISKKLIVR